MNYCGVSVSGDWKVQASSALESGHDHDLTHDLSQGLTQWCPQEHVGKIRGGVPSYSITRNLEAERGGWLHKAKFE